MQGDLAKPIGPPVLRTARMTLRLPAADDRAEFVRAMTLSMEHLRPWWPSRPEGESIETMFERNLQRACAEWADGRSARFIAFLDSGQMAGTFSLNNICRGALECADAGWSVMADCTGRGLATEAVRAVLDLAFSHDLHGLGLHRVQANVIPTNSASLKVARKCGFREEGLGRKMLQIDGRWQDHLMFAKLAEEHLTVHGAG